MKSKTIPEPKYNNEELMKRFIKSEPHSLLWDYEFKELSKEKVVALCEDLDAFWNWFEKVCKNTPLQVTLHGGRKEIDERNELENAIAISCGLVWAALYFHHNDSVPEKYKENTGL